MTSAIASASSGAAPSTAAAAETPTGRGRARFGGATIRRIEKINAFNHERLLEQQGSDSVVFDAITTGNFGGFDAWLDLPDPAAAGDLEVITNLATLALPLADVGLDDEVVEAGGLERRLRAFRLPEANDTFDLTTEIEVPLASTGDNPIWVCVTTEDGFQAWSSPIYAFRS